MNDEIKLFTERMHKLYLNFEVLEELKRNLEFILEIADIHSLDFAKRTLFNEEIKTKTYFQRDVSNYFFALNQELVEDYLNLKRNLSQKN